MTRRLAAAFAVALTPLAATVAIPAASTGTTCASLAALTIPNVTIKSAEAITAAVGSPRATSRAKEGPDKAATWGL